MANDSRERPFILQWRSAVLNSVESAPMKIALLAIAEFADTDGGSCFPSIETVARLSSLHARTARRLLLDSKWFVRTDRSGTGQAWRTYSYRLVMPEGADTRTARQSQSDNKAISKREDTAPSPSDETCGLLVQNVRAFSAEREGSAPSEIGLEIGKENISIAPLILKDGSEYFLSIEQLTCYQETYPGIDVLHEVRKMRQWTLDNPQKRKTNRGTPRFMNNWLSNAKAPLKQSGIRQSFQGTEYKGTPIDRIPSSLRAPND